MKKIFLATNNQGKIERFKYLLKEVDPEIVAYTPAELGIEALDPVEDGATLLDNAMIKAKAYVGKVDLPILSNDTGFYVEGEGLIDTPKRTALGDTDEHTLTKEEIRDKLLEFWKGIATKHGGKVDAAWVEAFVLIDTDGDIRKSESRREVLLTNQEFGTGHLQMPVRALYYSKVTDKPSILHTPEEELLEMQPVIGALASIVRKNRDVYIEQPTS